MTFLATGYALSEDGMWRSWNVDETTGEWRYVLWATMDSALDAAEATGLAPPHLRAQDLLVDPIVVPTLTRAGAARCRVPHLIGDEAEDASVQAVLMWSESVLRDILPDLDGVWWQRPYVPACGLAPHGTLFERRLPELDTRLIGDAWPEEPPPLPKRDRIAVDGIRSVSRLDHVIAAPPSEPSPW